VQDCIFYKYWLDYETFFSVALAPFSQLFAQFLESLQHLESLVQVADFLQQAFCAKVTVVVVINIRLKASAIFFICTVVFFKIVCKDKINT
jgi:hypothetical protein